MTNADSPGEEAGISPAVADIPKTAEAAAPKQEETIEKADTTEVGQADTLVKEASDEKSAATEPVAEAAKSEESSKETTTNGGEKKSNGETVTAEKKDDRSKKNNYRDGGKDRGYKKFNDRPKRRNNDHDEYEKLPNSDDPTEIREQVEFYFSTANLRQDNHMFFQCEGPFNRPVSIKHLCNFKRMRRFMPYTAVVAALRDSKTLDVLDDGEYRGLGKEAVKRKTPIVVRDAQGEDAKKHLVEELFYKFMKQQNDVFEASIYAKGFGDEEAAGQIELEQFFKPYGSIMIKKRRDEDGNWKGSVFVEFESEEAQKQFMELDPKPTFNGNELTIQGKKEYHEAKCKEKGIDPSKSYNTYNNNRGFKNDHRGRGGRGRGGRGGRGRGRGRDHRDDDRRRHRDRSGSPDSQDSRDWNGRRDKFQKSRDYKRDSRDDRDRRDKRDRRDRDGRDGRNRDSERRPNNKRKADDSDREDGTKKTKLEIKEDA
ncbi:hypothetical protein K491DRAFT_689173 [Lophiostoma macrostomum CBS 122681]|uniref:HTH La-type RNA-binding domain-containing protein n=1 Tax=Lophiostoma macrostomum CBS 122681 TaxID=1314788 RepID=A0A6A6THR2_9PLEO|nr:hypothetical protein K491DRAFT_689173 [Lophiostoma macrostomum CBS 122681]